MARGSEPLEMIKRLKGVVRNPRRVSLERLLRAVQRHRTYRSPLHIPAAASHLDHPSEPPRHLPLVSLENQRNHRRDQARRLKLPLPAFPLAHPQASPSSRRRRPLLHLHPLLAEVCLADSEPSLLPRLLQPERESRRIPFRTCILIFRM